MTKISEKLNIINSAKNDIKTAIENKGVTVGDVGIQDYASKIDEMKVATPITKGVIINEVDDNGYVLDASIVGMTEIPRYYFYSMAYKTSSYNALFGKIGENLHLPDEITTIGNYAFYGCSGLTIKKLPNALTSIGDYAFGSCTGLTLTELPDGITSLGLQAFNECKSLALTKLPSALKSMGNNVFYNCSNLALTKTPDNLTSISQRAFYGCTNMPLKEIPSKVTTINTYAFYNCKGITDLDIKAEGLKTIGSSAFSGCSNLNKLIIRTTTPPSISSDSLNSTGIANKTGFIYVPDESVSAYQGATNWTKYASQIKPISELEG